MIMRYLSAILLLFFSLSSLQLKAAVFKWDIPVNDRLEMVRTADVQYLVNSRLNRVYQERNIIDLTCYKRSPESSSVKGIFSVYSRDSADQIFQLREQYSTDFSVNRRGYMDVDKRYVMPNLRHIPYFPENDIKPGDSWKGPVNLLLKNFSIPLNLVLEAEYKLVSIEKQGGRSMATINYQFIIDKDLTKRRFPRDYPVKIYGQNSGTILWDMDKNIPEDIRDGYRVMLVFRDGMRGYGSIGFRMNMHSRGKLYSPVPEKEKDKAKEELKKELEKDKNIEVDTDKRGLVLRLGEVLFDFDSARLKKDTMDTLDRVAEVIKKKYPDREIIVEGHSDSIGKRNYNMGLSLRRALSVADHLKKKGSGEKLSYRGLGPDRPIADNKTKAGRKKNRRVEVIIKLH
jgi:outer membrane protein OmpA-like peptidoglycan-associated protein